MGGSAANTTFWAMHEWLMNNRDRISEQAIMDGAPAIGLPAESLSAGLNKPEATQRIKDDAAAMVKLGAGSIPAFFLNGKLVPRWKVGVVPIIQQLFDELPCDNPRSGIRPPVLRVRTEACPQL